MNANTSGVVGAVESARRAIYEGAAREARSQHHPNIRRAVGDSGWNRLPEAVR